MPQTIKLGRTEYVIITRTEYERLGGASGAPEGSVEATGWLRTSIGKDLRAAREHAGLTQVQLAKKLRKSQTLVSAAESGTVSVSERYTKQVLDACGLPGDWVNPEA